MYEIIKLPYPYNALEPDINTEIVDIHYNKHHKNYLKKLNEAINQTNITNIKLEDIPQNIDKYPLKYRGDILYNAGGVLNHNLYWQSMNNTPSKPTGKLLNKINLQYGNFENFRKDFIQRSQNLVGSGYTFLVANNRGDLTIINLVNQETPYSYSLIPLFTIDLWEHAYYLQYKNDRNSYINNFWNKANFNHASNLYDDIINNSQKMTNKYI